MKKLKLIVVYLLLAAAGQIVFTGCHTAHGFGEDVESAGQSIKDSTQ